MLLLLKLSPPSLRLSKEGEKAEKPESKLPIPTVLGLLILNFYSTATSYCFLLYLLFINFIRKINFAI